MSCLTQEIWQQYLKVGTWKKNLKARKEAQRRKAEVSLFLHSRRNSNSKRKIHEPNLSSEGAIDEESVLEGGFGVR